MTATAGEGDGGCGGNEATTGSVGNKTGAWLANIGRGGGTGCTDVGGGGERNGLGGGGFGGNDFGGGTIATN
jgi:hypothetical protein